MPFLCTIFRHFFSRSNKSGELVSNKSEHDTMRNRTCVAHMCILFTSKKSFFQMIFYIFVSFQLRLQFHFTNTLPVGFDCVRAACLCVCLKSRKYFHDYCLSFFGCTFFWFLFRFFLSMYISRMLSNTGFL